MSQFTLYRNTDKSTAETYPCFIDVQSDLLESLNTRLVVPLTPLVLLDKKAPQHLCPRIHLDAGDFVILTHQMTSVPTKLFINPVTHSQAFRNDISTAIDFLITGI